MPRQPFYEKNNEPSSPPRRSERGGCRASAVFYQLSIIFFSGLLAFDLFLRMNLLNPAETNFSNTVYIYSKNPNNQTSLPFDPTAPQPQQQQQSASSSSSSTNNDKPTCRDLMRAPNSPYVKGEFLTRYTTPVSWHPRADGSRRLEHSMCTLHRYTAAEAKRCLAGKHVHFVGDSLTRYQFMSLAWLVHKGSYPPRWERQTPCEHMDEDARPTCSPPDQPNICNYQDYNSDAPEGKWGFQHFIENVGGPVFDGRMEANGVRTEPMEIEHWTDNYVYASPEEERPRKVVLSYFQEIGWNMPSPLPLHGFNFKDCAFSGTCSYPDTLTEELEKRALNHSFAFEQDLTVALDKENGGVLHQHLPAPVDVFLYNRGIWGPMNETRAKVLAPLLKKHTEPQGRCFFQSSTGDSLAAAQFRHFWKVNELDMIRPLVTNNGCGFIDLAHLLQDFAELRHSPHELGFVMVDNVHFRPWVYEEINNMLLNILCNAA